MARKKEEKIEECKRKKSAARSLDQAFFRPPLCFVLSFSLLPYSSLFLAHSDQSSSLFLSVLPFQAPIPSALPRNSGTSSSVSSSSGLVASPRRGSVAAAAAPVSGPGADPSKRVVVTGMGVVSCLGNEVDEFYNNLLAVRREEEEKFLFYSAFLFSLEFFTKKERKKEKNTHEEC